MNRKNCNDFDAIEQVLSGNTDAFSELVRKYQGMVVGLAFHYVGNLHDAEDIGQEVFIQVYRRLSQLKHRDKFASWLRRITENHCKTWLRLNQKARHTLALDETLVHPAQKPPDAILLDKALSETVQHAIAQLSETKSPCGHAVLHARRVVQGTQRVFGYRHQRCQGAASQGSATTQERIVDNG